MNRRQRRAHARTWAVIGWALIVVAGAAMFEKVRTTLAVAHAQLAERR